MSLIKALKNRINFVKSDKTGLKGLLFMYIDRINKALGKQTNFYYDFVLLKSYKGKITKGDYFQIRDVILPLVDVDSEIILFRYVIGDTFYSYLNCNDKYDEETFDRCEKFLTEGFYGLVNSQVNVTVEPGDIVIDAGSWIGDFAAYASVKGATTYAFEPSDKNFSYLLQTAKLNKNIVPVKKGLSNENVSTKVFEYCVNSSADRLALTENDNRSNYIESSSSVETIRLDDFVHENNLPRVDFIKSDIEGFERHMLAGAQGVLREFAPKLALCTYHLPDDPEVMADLIKQANPKYNIVQKRMKLFASVPE